MGKFHLRLIIFVVAFTIALPFTLSFSGIHVAQAASLQAHRHMHIDCSQGRSLCVDVKESDDVFGHYVGHDEPSVLFYSQKAGSGNQMNWALRLPKDPQGTQPAPGQSYNFQLHPAFWFGMAICDTQSYPEQVSTCTPDSDNNIVDPATSPNHPGTAFMEMQFYPPGWVKWPLSTSCDATKWCAALNIDSLSVDPVNGTQLNAPCVQQVGVEYINFAFITLNGVPQAPPNPVQATLATFTPDPTKDLLMNSGDMIQVAFKDTTNGLQVLITDQTTNQQGSMTASAANMFGQVKFAPAPSTECTNIPYDFHPMYSTSSEQTRVPWAAHSYNVAFADETGHFDFCNGASFPIGANCPTTNTEGVSGDTEPADGDDIFCLPASASSAVQVSGCRGSNTGFDGVPYQPLWPDGSAMHPDPILFTSPVTGAQLTDNYDRMAFEADLPAIEDPHVCNILTGNGCTLIPTTDDGNPATFYPFFSTGKSSGNACIWALGNDIPGFTQQDFMKNAQYGSPVGLPYTTVGGRAITLFPDFRQVLTSNPCPFTSSIHQIRIPLRH